jgi:hypothetical protein
MSPEISEAVALPLIIFRANRCDLLPPVAVPAGKRKASVRRVQNPRRMDLDIAAQDGAAQPQRFDPARAVRIGDRALADLGLLLRPPRV